MNACRTVRGALLATLVSLSLLACTERPAQSRAHTQQHAAMPEQQATVMVFASASLTEPFQALARRFEQEHTGTRVELHLAGTPQLIVQAREGAPVDVFASADEPSMERMLEAAAAIEGSRVFATNRLAIVTARGNPKGIEGIEDLARPDLLVALCGPQVPAGRYAREALDRAGIRVRSVSDEPSVRAIVSKVAMGELDAGIVYATDVTPAARAVHDVEAVAIADGHNVVARYSIAALATGRQSDLAVAFVAFVFSPPGQAVLGSFGFATP